MFALIGEHLFLNEEINHIFLSRPTIFKKAFISSDNIEDKNCTLKKTENFYTLFFFITHLQFELQLKKRLYNYMISIYRVMTAC